MTQYSTTTPVLTGTVYLVGAGPGDAELITVKGLNLLRCAGAVVYDALVNPALLDEAPRAAERIYAGKRAGNHAMRQEEINEVLRCKAHEHAVVVRLKGGDPFVFGRGGEEMAYLRAAGVPVEVVPGISSAIGAAAAAGVPVTHRAVSGSFAVVAGYQSGDAPGQPRWDALALIDTVVIMMGLRNAGPIARSLIGAGRDPQTPAMVVFAATLPTQQIAIATLDTLEAAVAMMDLDAPATIVVGDVVNLADPEACMHPDMRTLPVAPTLFGVRLAGD